MAARGGLLKLLDAYIAIGGDTSEFDKAVDQSEAKAKKAGGRIESAFSPRRVLGALGTAAGVAFGVALVGANQLDAATRQLQADTGMTAAEAKVAEHALAGMYRNNLQGFDAIGAAMAKVHNDLGLTGAAADRATAKFLKFSTATKQDAAAAVASFDDILDAWNLTAEDATGLMDGLIADHHKFGGAIAESQSALAAMAPAMQAANMSIDDGRALLNLFNAAGIDAAKAPAALARAVKELKPGQSLDDLIAQISSIEDPTLRGQKAMEIFGVRGGVQLAQAFKPGIQSLDAFAISATDAAGATEDAAGAIESGFGAKFKMILKNAGGALAEFGTNFGDLLMLTSVFGPRMMGAISAGLGGLSGVLIPKVTAAVLATGPGAALAASSVGTTIGAAMGAAVPLALVAGLGLAIGGAIGMAIEGPIVDAAKKDMAKSVGNALANAVTQADLDHMKSVIQDGIDRMNAGEGTLFGWDIFGGKDALQKQLDDVDAEIERRAAGLPAAAADGITANAPKVEIAVDQLVATLGTSMTGVRTAAKITGADGMAAMAAGITAARSKPLDAFDTLKAMLKTAMSSMGEVARLHGELTSKELARGIKSRDPAVRAQAIAVVKAAADRLGELAVGGGKAGKAAMIELNKGVRSKIPAVREASKAAKDAAVAQLYKTKAPAKTAGAAAGGAFASALVNKVTAALAQAAGITARFGGGGAPPLPAIPRLASGTPFVPRDMLAFVHRGEMVISAAPSADIRAGRATLGAGGEGPGGAGGPTINVYNPVPEPASESVPRALANLAFLGSGA